jgi:uncharacterized protein YegL
VKQARDGLVEQLNTIKTGAKKSGPTYVTLISFDDEIVTHFDAVPVDEMNQINPEAIVVPRGMTAMNDAVMKAIKLLKAQDNNTDNVAYLVTVISDGMENASETSSPALAAEIKKLEESEKWTFSFMLANVDIKNITRQLNLSESNVAAFAASEAGMTMAYQMVNNSTLGYFNRRSVGETQTKTFFQTEDQTVKTETK